MITHTRWFVIINSFRRDLLDVLTFRKENLYREEIVNVINNTKVLDYSNLFDHF